MTPPPDLHALYTVMCLAGGVVFVSAVGLAMLGPEDKTNNKKTIKRGRLPVAPPRDIKPTPKEQRCYGSARRLVEIQREWKLAHAPAPVLPAAPMSKAGDDGFVHWFENCIEIQDVKSAADIVSYDDLDKSYLAYCQEQNVPVLEPEDFARLLGSYSTSQGCKFDPNTGDLTYVRLKN
jgi:hypothetical protein